MHRIFGSDSVEGQANRTDERYLVLFSMFHRKRKEKENVTSLRVDDEEKCVVLIRKILIPQKTNREKNRF
jgi:hypothetical protein